MMPAIRPASAKRQAKRQSPTRSRTMRRYLRIGAVECPRFAADARHLYRGRRRLRHPCRSRPHSPALRARARSRSLRGRCALLGGHARGGCALLAVWASHRPLRPPIPDRLLARHGSRIPARRGRRDHRPTLVCLAGCRRARLGSPDGGPVFGGDRSGEERTARPRDGMADLLDAGRVLHRPFRRRTPAQLALNPHRPGGDHDAARVRRPRRAARKRHQAVVPARAFAPGASPCARLPARVCACRDRARRGHPDLGHDRSLSPDLRKGGPSPTKCADRPPAGPAGGGQRGRPDTRGDIGRPRPASLADRVRRRGGVGGGHRSGFWAPAIVLVAATPFMATVYVAIGVVFADLSAASTRGVTMGIYGTVLFLGLAAGPLVFGPLVQGYGYAAGFTACAAVAVALASVMAAFQAEPLRRRAGVRLPPPAPGT